MNFGFYIFHIVHYYAKHMSTTRIIGHRGAAGLALENTLPSFEKAIAVGVKTIEFDVHTTSDSVFIACHDQDLGRVSDSRTPLRELTAEEVQSVTLRNGAKVPTLRQILDLARRRGIALIIELKDIPDPEALCKLLDEYSDLDLTAASFHHDLLAKLRALRPQLRLYLAESHRPFAVLRRARAMNAQGIDLHWALMNPLAYLLAKRWNLHIMIFTVDGRLLGRLLLFLYPGVTLCTNRPDRFIPPQKQG